MKNKGFDLHPHIEEVRKYYLEDYICDEKASVAKKLFEPKDATDLPRLKKMWLSLQKAEEAKGIPYDHSWVQRFISAVFVSSKLPPYYYKNNQENTELIDEIKSLTQTLSRKLSSNELSYHLIYSDGKIFNGFYCFEDFEESNRSRINDVGNKKIDFITILQMIHEVAEREILQSKTTGKSGSNIRAIRFIRALSEYINKAYDKPLNEVISTATYAIYGIERSAGDICNLRGRRKKIKK